jgi:D-amino-acid dehydrogenase
MKKPDACLQLPLSLEERKLAATPMGDRLRLSSALELVGYDSAINPRRVAAIYAGARDYLAKIDESSPAEPWCGFRPLTPDSLPIIGRSPQHDNLTIAAGHGTLGITQGPVTGQLVTQLLAAEQPDIDLHPLRVSRFPQPR